jgi:hypothetical protein
MFEPKTVGRDAGARTRVSDHRRLRAPAVGGGRGREVDLRSADLAGSTRAGDAPGRDHPFGRLSTRRSRGIVRRCEQRRGQAERRTSVRRVRSNRRLSRARVDGDGATSERREPTRRPPHLSRRYREIRLRGPVPRLRAGSRRRRLPRRRGTGRTRGRRTSAARPRRHRRPTRNAGRNPPRSLVSRRRRSLWWLPARQSAHERDDRSARALRRLLPRDELRQVPGALRARAQRTPRPHPVRQRSAGLSSERRCHGSAHPRRIGGSAPTRVLEERLSRDRRPRAERGIVDPAAETRRDGRFSVSGSSKSIYGRPRSFRRYGRETSDRLSTLANDGRTVTP